MNVEEIISIIVQKEMPYISWCNAHDCFTDSNSEKQDAYSEALCKIFSLLKEYNEELNSDYFDDFIKFLKNKY